jgi:hypothetical protein
VIIATAAPETGRAAVIDFDSLPASTNVSGVPNNAASVLTTQFDTDGIVFGFPGVSAGVAVVQLTTFNEVSPPNTIVDLDALGEIPAFASGDIHFRFVLPGTGLPGITNTVSFQVGDDCCDEDGFVVRAYDLADTLLDTQLIVGSPMPWRCRASIGSTSRTSVRTPAIMPSTISPSPPRRPFQRLARSGSSPSPGSPCSPGDGSRVDGIAVARGVRSGAPASGGRDPQRPSVHPLLVEDVAHVLAASGEPAF